MNNATELEPVQQYYLNDPGRSYEFRERGLDNVRKCAYAVEELKRAHAILFDLSANGLLPEVHRTHLAALSHRALQLCNEIDNESLAAQEYIMSLLPRENDDDPSYWG